MPHPFTQPSYSQKSQMAGDYRTATQRSQSAFLTQGRVNSHEAAQPRQYPLTTRPPLSQSQGHYNSTALSQPFEMTTQKASRPPVLSNPAAVIARQKARYARGYIPPPGLRQSQLNLTAQDSQMQTQTQRAPAVSQRQDAFDGPSSQPAPSRTAVGNNTNVRNAAPQLFATTPVEAGAGVAAPLSEKCVQMLITMQERQLECWQQLVSSLQQLTFDVQGISEDVRCLREEHTHLKQHWRQQQQQQQQQQQVAPAAACTESKKTLVTAPLATTTIKDALPSLSRKRSCSHRNDDNGQDDTEHGKAKQQKRSSASASVTQRLVTVHSVRLIGGSATSTQAFATDDAASIRLEASRADGTYPAAALERGTDGSVSDVADSEADLFLL